MPLADRVPVQVAAPGMGRRQAVHECLQFPVTLGPQDKVPVIRHHAIREDAHRDALKRAPDDPFERIVVSGLLEQMRALVPPIEDVKDHPPWGNACAPWHFLRPKWDLSPFQWNARSRLRYWIASATCEAASVAGAPSRSAMVRATLRMRV